MIGKPWDNQCRYCGAYIGHYNSCIKSAKLGPQPTFASTEEHDAVLNQNPKKAFGDRKVALGAVLPVAMVHEGMAMMEGDFKYGFRNFRKSKVEAMTYIHAAMRHIEAWAEGEETADDSGVHHLGHARACLGILLDAQANNKLIDDRVPGAFSKVLKKMEDWVAKRREHYAKKNTQANTVSPSVKSHEEHHEEIDRLYDNSYKGKDW